MTYYKNNADQIWHENKPKFDKSTPEAWAKSWLDEIEHTIKNGLSQAYENATEFLYDLYPNLPWSGLTVAKLVVADPRWLKLCEQFVAKFNVTLADPTVIE